MVAGGRVWLAIEDGQRTKRSPPTPCDINQLHVGAALSLQRSHRLCESERPNALVGNLRTASKELTFLWTGERHCISAVAFMVAGGGFEPPTFGLCDLTHLSMRVGLYLHPRGMLAIESLRLPPPFRGLGSVLPVRTPTTSWKIERREV